jgi:hypothetical protein
MLTLTSKETQIVALVLGNLKKSQVENFLFKVSQNLLCDQYKGI